MMKILILFTFSLFLALPARPSLENIPEHPLSGKWYVQIQMNDVGYLQTYLYIETDGTKFIAYSRKNALKDVLGFTKSVLARIFTSGYAKGSLLQLNNGEVMKGEKNFMLEGMLQTPIGERYFVGEMKEWVITGSLRYQDIHKGKLKARKDTTPPNKTNYIDLFAQAEETIAMHVCNPEFLQDKGWYRFRKKMRKVSRKAQDDVDMLLGFFYHSRNLPFSHCYLYRQVPESFADLQPEPDLRDGGTKQLELIKPRKGVAYLRIHSFSVEPDEIDSVFNIVRNLGYDHLIIDLRTNSGGDLSSMQVAANLVDSSVPGGVFITRKWFRDNKFPPGEKDLDLFPVLTEANQERLWDGIHRDKGMVLEVNPASDVYKGNVYVLTSRYTASASEPLVYGLKHYNLATIVGEHTAGSMLSSEQFRLENDWILVIPTADYYTSDGIRLDQQGVAPHYEVPASEAYDYVVKNLIINN